VKNRRVAITGLGLVNPYGEGDVEDFFSRIMCGESAVRYHTLSDSPRPLALPLVACSHFNPIAVLGPPLANAMDRFSHFAMAAAFSAWQDSGLEKHCNREDYGVSWGTGSGGSLTIERGYQKLYFENKDKVSPLSVVLAMNNSAASHIAMQLGLGGPCNTTYGGVRFFIGGDRRGFSANSRRRGQPHVGGRLRSALILRCHPGLASNAGFIRRRCGNGFSRLPPIFQRPRRAYSCRRCLRFGD